MKAFCLRQAKLVGLGLLMAAQAAFAAPGDFSSFGNVDPQTGQFNTPGYPAANPSSSPGSNQGSGGRYRSQPSYDPALPQSGQSSRDNNNASNTTNAEADRAAQEAELRRRLAPPPRPTEFQRFVERATGRMLPMFGARFFADALDGFSPLDNVPVPADYTVGPGDEIAIRAWGSIDVDYRATVDRNGLINLPRVGSFTVAGVKASQLEQHLRAQIGRIFTNFNLNVTLGQLRGVKVFVVGPAQRPGVYTLSSQATLLSAVVAAGGPSPQGSMRKVSVRRDGRIISELDIYEFLVQGDKSKDVQLAAGDVVVFQPAGARVAITGSIDTPAIFELKGPQEPVREVLRYAGGTPVVTNPNRAQLERIDTTQTRSARYVEEFRLDGNGLQKSMRDGDVLTLLEISPQFGNAVTLKGHVAQPLRYPFTPGMRILDLIPDKEALISPDFYRRKNLLVQVIEDDDPRVQQDRPRNDRRYDGRSDYGNNSNNGDPSASGSRNNADRANGDRRNGNYADNDRQRDDSSSYDTDRQGNRGTADNRRDARNSDDSRLLGDERRAPKALFDDLNWDYAVIERLNREDLSTQIIPFNLGKAVLGGDPTQNLELMPGDVVTIYSQKDLQVPVAKQTRLVSVEGEVGSPGVYQLLPGETLRQLLARAGGFSREAYIYGLEFSRESTRKRQRENLKEAIARLESVAATQSARDAANRRDDVSSERGAAISNAATQAQMARLARIQPNGRIALELPPDAAGLSAVPDVPLENADRVIVPPRPGFVTVAGAVANNNAFLWKPGRKAGDYLRLAGVDEAADPNNAFILRADGTVTHANDSSGFLGFGGGVAAQTLQPGDAVIVPNQLDYETWGRALVRNLKDFSQIFYQFGLGAAAIQTLRNN
ncbi:MAG: hypothetical protein JWP52_2314 [Rhizobacter sp.]|nr:hypothetical protein [Rhizobacter sp.]